MAEGYYKMHRGWMDHPIFRRDRFSRAQAWEWMISEANWRDSAGLKIGQLSHSIRHMATVWKWDVASVARLLRRLETATMIETDTATGQTVITICNYKKYQADEKQAATQDATPTATLPQRTRNASATIHKKEEGRRKKDTSSSFHSELAAESGAENDPEKILETDWLPDKKLYAFGKAVLGAKAGGQITKLLSAHNGNHLDALAALQLAAEKQDPAEYVAGILKPKPKATSPPLIPGIG